MKLPITLTVEHIELWFFDDINVAFLKVELSASDLPFAVVCDLLYRFGRAYPTGWDKDGHGKHNAYRAEWLSADGAVLAVSDSDDQEKFLSYTRKHRSPGISAHWDFLLRPLVLDPSEEIGDLRYRQIEYHRMPLMAFLAVDDPRSLSRESWLRLGLVATLHPDEAMPTHDPDVAEFESRYCYDRFWTDTDAGPNTRFLCTGRAFIVVGDARADYFHDPTRGILAQFRHQYVLLFMIAHFHRASLLVFSDRMVDAVHDLDIRVAQSISRFRRRVYAGFEAFLRFTHRYWFHELSERPHVQALYRMCSEHLGNDALYQEVKEELQDMSQYLDSNAQRQQSTTIVRLTVVTVFSMVAAVVTGFFGMNLLAYADQPLDSRVEFFFIVTLITTVLMLLTLLYSKRISDVMDVLADDQKSLRTRLSMLGKAWQRNPSRTSHDRTTSRSRRTAGKSATRRSPAPPWPPEDFLRCLRRCRQDLRHVAGSARAARGRSGRGGGLCGNAQARRDRAVAGRAGNPAAAHGGLPEYDIARVRSGCRAQSAIRR